MRAINHSLTGALIGLTIADPLIAVPLAFCSHFILDSLPHFGENKASEREKILSKTFLALLVIDAIACIALVGLLALTKPSHWLLAAICAFVAASPDFFSSKQFYAALKNHDLKPGRFIRFASKIQWFERPIGAVVEAVWLVSFIFCLSIFIKR